MKPSEVRQRVLAEHASLRGVLLSVEDNYLGGLYSELSEAASRTKDLSISGLTARRIPKSAKTAAEVFTHVGTGLEQIVAMARGLVRP